jgi:hypothetical protein
MLQLCAVTFGFSGVTKLHLPLICPQHLESYATGDTIRTEREGGGEREKGRGSQCKYSHIIKNLYPRCKENESLLLHEY